MTTPWMATTRNTCRMGETGEMELLPLLTEYHELVEKQQQRSSPSLDAVLSNAERLMPGSGTSLRTAFKMKYLVKIFEPFETREEVDAALYSLHCFVQERIDRDNENRTSYSCAGGKQSQSEVEISKRHNLYTRPMLRAVEKKHGPLRIWDLSKIQDLKLLLSGWPHNPQSDLARPHNRTSFAGRGFNEDISQWDVSGATTMELMFYENKDFNQPLDAWNTSRVTNLQYCFAGCLAFDQDIRQWDVSKVTNMEGMFSCAVNFDRDLNGWDVRKVTSMARMFQHAKRFNQALDRWEVGITTNLEEIFHGAEAFNHSLASWIVSGSTNCRQMLATASAFRQLPPQGALAFDIFGPHDESSCSSGTVLISGSRQQDEVTPEAAQLDDGGAQDWSAVGLPSAAGEWWHWFRENQMKKNCARKTQPGLASISCAKISYSYCNHACSMHYKSFSYGKSALQILFLMLGKFAMHLCTYDTFAIHRIFRCGIF
ncbi:unnamed protein product [Amoebophrya sp. A120]|nr:unnamed protein product [Amoebophrya sp. A120]|eukprot:GSA120T00025098001.1